MLCGGHCCSPARGGDQEATWRTVSGRQDEPAGGAAPTSAP